MSDTPNIKIVPPFFSDFHTKQYFIQQNFSTYKNNVQNIQFPCGFSSTDTLISGHKKPHQQSTLYARNKHNVIFSLLEKEVEIYRINNTTAPLGKPVVCTANLYCLVVDMGSFFSARTMLILSFHGDNIPFQIPLSPSVPSTKNPLEIFYKAMT